MTMKKQRISDKEFNELLDMCILNLDNALNTFDFHFEDVGRTKDMEFKVILMGKFLEIIKNDAKFFQFLKYL